MLLFPEGLIGLPHWRRFRMEQSPNSALRHLVSLDADDVVFTICPVGLLQPGYLVELAAEDETPLADVADGTAWVTLRQGPAGILANLKGPLLISADGKRGVQVACPRYPEQHLVAELPTVGEPR